MGTRYDKWMEKGESTLEDELSLVISTFPEPCKLLDVGCGTGRVSLLLQEKGYDIVGVDISKGMLEQAIRKGLNRTYNMDFLDFVYPASSFDGIISLHAGFSYTQDKNKIRSIMKKCWNLLRSKGKLLWDTPNEDFYGKQRILEWPAGKTTVETICYGHNVNFLKILFEQNDFEVKNIWGSYTPLQKYTKGLPRIIVEAERK
ncbi:MAG: class I SAM-dependent methyltransferase [Bacteroidales bacterium]|nr:class I SAM-dependent methyltransferase [Bacteroidales bacterium]